MGSANRQRQRRKLLAVAGFLVTGILIARVLLTTHKQLPLQAHAEVANFDISSFVNARRLVNYEQPNAELIEKISKVYDTSVKSESHISESSNNPSFVIINGVPFYSYWQNEAGKHAFHPMALGIFLGRLSCNEPIKEYVNAAIGMAHELPNGELLWYYPDNYRLNRFLGPDLTPSAIGQAQILGAITELDKRCNLDLSAIARRVFLGLKFDYYQGGVNLENKALLEFPLFRSAPEIILNGWLHALLNLKKYVDTYHDAEAERLFNENLKFLAKVLPNFHDERTGLSRYSDLSPYRVRVHYQSNNPPKLTAFYKARIQGFDDLAFDLKVINHDTRSPYDNQIIRQTQTFTDIWISCSQNYETYLVSDAPITVTFNAGEYSPHRSMPGSGGEQIELKSTRVGDYYVVHITSVRKKLFCGYPTNFSKMGENYYHTYHVVALACLLTYKDLPDRVRASLRTWMERWIRTIETYNSSSGLRFASYNKVLKDLVEHKVFTLTDDWNTFLKMARQTK